MSILPCRQWLFLLATFSACSLVLGQTPVVDNHFTYQGQIKQNGTPYNGNCDLTFTLWTDVIGGTQVGNTANMPSVSVSNGLFTVHLDMSNVFDGNKRWMQVQAACPSGSSLITLTPRQELTVAPHTAYALKAGSATASASTPWSGLTGVPSGFADGVDNDTTYSAGAGLTLSGNVFSLTMPLANSATTATPANTAGAIVARDGSGNFSAGTITANLTGTATNAVNATNATNAMTAVSFSGSLSGDVTGTQGVTSVVRLRGQLVSSTAPTIGQALKWDGKQWSPGTDNNTTSFWSLTGNAGTNPATNFLGTTDNTALELRVNNSRALRIEPNASSPNIIGGYSGNIVDSGMYGATISGGGMAGSNCGQSSNRPCYNQVTDRGGAIGGGAGNTASYHDTVGGGEGNTAYGLFTTVAGGFDNNTSNEGATVVGGYHNTASGSWGAVGGGASNIASGSWATVPGGGDNLAQGYFSFAAGRRAKAYNQGCFVLADSTDADEPCYHNNRFVFRVTNAFYIWTTTDKSAGTVLGTGGSQWLPLSDRATKANFAAVDVRDILARLVAMPVETWNLKSQDPTIRHIGPTAQDFHAAFAFGEDEKRIGTQDADGVMMAAIQGLYQELQDRDAKIATLEARLTELEQVLKQLAAAQKEH